MESSTSGFSSPSSEYMSIYVDDECSPLRTVVIGIGDDPGPTPEIGEAYDAKSYESILRGLYPSPEEIKEEVDGFARAVADEGVKVLRPQNLPGCNQLFTRDAAFVIEDTLIRANIIPQREAELSAYSSIFSRIDPSKIVIPPAHVHIEGGDVILFGDKIFLGTYLSPDYATYKMARTNKYAIGFVKDLFPHKEIIPLELLKHDTDPHRGILHLDCCFQPVGRDKALLYPGGFRHVEDWEYLVSLFGVDNVMILTREEMYEMNPNVFSLSPGKVVIDATFARLKKWLNTRGIETIEVKYRKVSRLGGLLRCTSLPLYRQ